MGDIDDLETGLSLIDNDEPFSSAAARLSGPQELSNSPATDNANNSAVPSWSGGNTANRISNSIRYFDPRIGKEKETIVRQLLDLNLGSIRQLRQMSGGVESRSVYCRQHRQHLMEADHRLSISDEAHYPVGEILQSAQTFRYLLSNLQIPATDDDASVFEHFSPSATYRPTGTLAPQLFEASTSGPRPYLPVIGPSESVGQTTGYQPEYSLSGSSTQPYHAKSNDPPLALLIISCYLSMIHVYNTLFTDIEDSFLGINSRWNPSRFGDLPTTLLVAVAEHALDEVEHATGYLSRQFLCNWTQPSPVNLGGIGPSQDSAQHLTAGGLLALITESRTTAGSSNQNWSVVMLRQRIQNVKVLSGLL